VPAWLGSFDVAVAGDLLTLSSNLADGRSCTASGRVTPTYGGVNAPESILVTGGWIFARMTSSSCPDLQGLAVAVKGAQLWADDGLGTQELPTVCANRSIRATR
jgi:hypothetical protein